LVRCQKLAVGGRQSAVGGQRSAVTPLPSANH